MAELKSDSLFLGVDISTQQVKVIVIDSSLKTVYEDAVKFDIDFPEFKTQGGVNVNDDKLTVTSPTLMWVKALDKILLNMQKNGVKFCNIAALSGSGQQHGSVYWSRGAKEVLANMCCEESMFNQLQRCFSVTESPVWMDSSTRNQCQALEMAIGGPEELARLTGSKAYERFTGNQIAKIYQQFESKFKSTERISLVSSFGASLFIGDFAPIDYADGSGMNLMSLQCKAWVKKCLDACAPGLDKLLGDPVASDSVAGKVSSYMVHRYGFNPDCDVVAFTGDNPSSLAGMRLQSGDMVVSLGTSDTLFMWLNEPKPAVEGHIFVNPVESQAYMALLCYKNGSLTREKIRNNVAGGQWPEFENLLQLSPKGNNGNIGMYFDIAEITPTNAVGYYRFNADGKPVATFSDAEEVRAIIEGQFIAKRVHAEMLGYSVLKGETRILATGGASASLPILQVLADVFSSDVYVLDIQNSAALGSAYRAKHGRQKFDGVTFQEAIAGAPPFSCVAKPDSDVKALYDKLSARFKYLEQKYIRDKNI